MVNGESRLRGALDLLVTDEPVLDLYAHGLFPVPDGLLDEVSARIDGLVADGRSARLTVGKQPGPHTPTPAVVADALSIVAFLCGDAAVRAGSRLRLECDLIERFRLGTVAAADPTVRWAAPSAPWRPPGGQLFRAAGDDRALREVAWELTVDILEALEGMAPFETRRQALLKLFAAARKDVDLFEATLTTPLVRAEWIRLEERWADVAGDDLVAVLPELTGPVGYLSWIVDGWLAAHERLAALVPFSATSANTLVSLLVQAGRSEAPAELAVGVRGELYAHVRSQLPIVARTWDAEAWRRQVRDWLARALVAGELELCRAWLDLAVRFTGAVQGLPGTPVAPRPCLVPVGWFQEDVRRLFRVRRVRHPLTGTNAMPGWLTVEEAFPFGSQLASRTGEASRAGDAAGVPGATVGADPAGVGRPSGTVAGNQSPPPPPWPGMQSVPGMQPVGMPASAGDGPPRPSGNRSLESNRSQRSLASPAAMSPSPTSRSATFPSALPLGSTPPVPMARPPTCLVVSGFRTMPRCRSRRAPSPRMAAHQRRCRPTPARRTNQPCPTRPTAPTAPTAPTGQSQLRGRDDGDARPTVGVRRSVRSVRQVCVTAGRAW